jgi:hypothetical protein
MRESTYRLRQKLLQLATLDRNRRIFGSHEPWGSGHEYQLYPALGAGYLERGEAYHNVQLPQDYRDFLLYVANGGAGPHYGLYSLEEGIGHTHPSEPFPFEFAPVQSDDPRLGSGWREATPGIVRLNDQGCGYYSFLVVNGVAYGTVWTDWTEAGEGLEPTHSSFTAWYEAWLDRSIALLRSEQVLESVQPGLSLDEVVALVGRDFELEKRLDGEGIALVFSGTYASVILNAQGRVEEVRHNVFA